MSVPVNCGNKIEFSFGANYVGLAQTVIHDRIIFLVSFFRNGTNLYNPQIIFRKNGLL